MSKSKISTHSPRSQMRRGKSKNLLIEGYLQSWNYLKISRNFIYAIIIIFFLFSFIGFFTPTPEIIEQQILKFIQELLERTQDMSQGDLITFILLNNLQSSFTGMIFGFFLGIFPMLAVITNGYLLGFVASESVKVEGVLILWRLLPHGIFELPAIFISLGLGLKLGTFIFQRNKAESFRDYFWNSLRVFLLIVIPLLIIASIIEGNLIFFSS